MKVIVYQKYKDGRFDMAIFTENGLTEEKNTYYIVNEYMKGVYESVGDFVGSLVDTTMSDGECLDMLVELCDKGFVESYIEK